ncbi:YciI family protein [Pseudomonas indica]|uniref:Uncharacterized conserved protein n=1 Tax=Pseudomonas indica TaxID=137658 RepID=A0A1G9JU89_9PSED|nr:YciI family protein [Pseudomonas indica]SDL40942.1 Uncharacterized conserved protein [Pseudomonas indica]
MKYLCLIYVEERLLDTVPAAELTAIEGVWLDYHASLRQSGRMLAGEALQPAESATTLRLRNGKLSLADGPSVDTREQLAGFYLIDAGDLDDAIRLAARIPQGRVGSIEVRPVRPLGLA